MFDIKHSFPNQKKDEKVYIFIRRYPLAFLPFLVLILGMIFVFIIVVCFIWYYNPNIFSEIGKNILVLSASTYFLFCLVIFMIGWLDFYFDVHIVTNQRVVDIDQFGLFHRRIDELNLDQVEDVSCLVKGFLGTIFNYGIVEVQTAGTERNFFLQDISNPTKVAQRILSLSEKVAKRDN